MSQEEPTTLHGRCTTVVNKDSHYEDSTEIKWQINLLMQEQTKQQETFVHIISILNVT